MSQAPDDASARAAARVGQILRGKWRLDLLLGIGGTAYVYAGMHRNGQRGAVKLLRPEYATDEPIRRRFLLEGYVSNRVSHPCAVAVLDDDVAEDGLPFLVMELLEGVNLDEQTRARVDGRLSPGEVVFIADRLLDVLASAHEKGIVHRDIKPENVFLTRTGDVKLLDFGIARLDDTPQAGPGPGRLTEVGSVMGTPAFMPPEQALGHTANIDGRTDLWALGAVLFYALTGRVIHETDTVNKVLLLAMTRQAPPLASVSPGLPAGLCEVIDRALAFNQGDRYPDARAMQQALRAVKPQIALIPPSLQTTPGSPPAHHAFMTSAPLSSDVPGGRSARASRARTWALGGLLLAAVCGLGALVFVMRGGAPRPMPTAPAAQPPPSAPAPLPEAAPPSAPPAAPPPEAASPQPPGSAEPSAEPAPQAPALKPATSAPKAIPRPTNRGTTKKSSDKDLFGQW
jgi:eukaryotic-like serine/threonine-protein kinase